MNIEENLIHLAFNHEEIEQWAASNSYSNEGLKYSFNEVKGAKNNFYGCAALSILATVGAVLLSKGTAIRRYAFATTIGVLGAGLTAFFYTKLCRSASFLLLKIGLDRVAAQSYLDKANYPLNNEPQWLKEVMDSIDRREPQKS